MKMITGRGYGQLTCEVSSSKHLSFNTRHLSIDPSWPLFDAGMDTDPEVDPKTGLRRETAGYAACRYLRKNPALCWEYVRESYELRLSTGKNRRARRHYFVAPASLMELPGNWAYISVSVSATGVVVDHVGLYTSMKEAKKAALRYHHWS